MSAVEVRALSHAAREDFMRLHERRGCFCAAWWVPTWEEWGARTAADNRALREELLDRGELDGYLLFVDGEPAGWCQAGPRDRLPKLVAQYRLEADPSVWAITCFDLRPDVRGRGLARRLLEEVLGDLRARGVRRVEAFPKRDESEPDEVWTGPEPLFAGAGFTVVREHPSFPVLAIDLA